MRLVGFAIYISIGAVLHALFVGVQFDWSSAWTWAWVFGWPLMILAGLALMIGVVAVIFLISLGIDALRRRVC